MNEKVIVEGCEKYILDIVNPPGLFIGGNRQSSQVVPQQNLSIRMSAEYAGRQNIRDMFLKASARSLTPSSTHTIRNGSQNSDSSTNTQDTTVTDNPTEADDLKNSSSPATVTYDSTSKPGSLSTTSRARVSLQILEPPAKRQKKAPSIKKPLDSTRRKPPPCGQQSLTAFLKKPLSSPEKPYSPPAEHSFDNQQDSIPSIPNESLQEDNEVLSQTRDAIVYHEEGSFPSVDPIVSKEKWSQLFTKPMVPRCEAHKEPCIQRITRKPGANAGRAFWMCSRLVLIL